MEAFNTVKKPNFFIVGFPKCGTTTMSHYLASHPYVFFSRGWAEPHYFNTDFPEQYRNYTDLHTYLTDCYSGSAEYKAVGESSPLFIYSKEAIPNILEFNPDAQFIVMIRNPIEKARSSHAHALKKGQENVADFETAWHLQEARRNGKHIPKRCTKPFLLQYGEQSKIGTYIHQLYTIVPKAKIKIIFLDDMREQPGEVYRSTLAFLGLDDDGKTDFRAYNKNKQWHSTWLRSTTNTLRQLKRKSGVTRSLGVISFLRSVGMRQQSHEKLSPEFYQKLTDYFTDEIHKVAKITGIDVSH